MNDLILMGVLRQQNEVMRKALEEIRDMNVYIWWDLANTALDKADKIEKDSK